MRGAYTSGRTSGDLASSGAQPFWGANPGSSNPKGLCVAAGPAYGHPGVQP